MFKYKLIMLSTIFLFSCGKQNETKEHIKEGVPTKYDSVINQTDSLINFADKKINKIKKNNKQKMFIMDSLQQTIEIEQHTINNLSRYNQQIIIRENEALKQVDEARTSLEIALMKCKEKEKELENLKEVFELKSEKYMDEKITLVNFYNNKIDSLIKRINILEKDSSIIDFLDEKTNKKKKKRRNGKNN